MNRTTTPYMTLESESDAESKQFPAQVPALHPVAPVPACQPRAMAYPQQPPAYNPQAMAYPQQAPVYNPQAMAYPQQAPVYNPQAMAYPQQPPAYNPQAMAYPQQATAYNPQAMAYPQQVPGCSSEVPAYGPQDSGSQPHTPGYKPLAKPPQAQQNNFTDVFVSHPEPFSLSFSDKSVRAAFVRKVYAILMTQLLVTIGIIALFVFHSGIKHYVTHNFAMYMSAYFVFWTTYITLVCCGSIRRQHPHNLILLVIFTLSMAYMAGVLSAYHDVMDVFMALGITAAVCLGLSLFAIQTKWDVSGYGMYLFVASLVIMLFGIISMFVAIYAGDRIMNVVYAGLVAILFSMYLVYDTQQIIGGRKVELSPEEYVYGALQLYVDIVQIFLVLLYLGSRK